MVHHFCMGLTAFAVLMPACILLILDHVAGTSFFVPSNLVINDQLQPHSGGSTLLWQHLFWFFGHPEVYIAIVPGMGIVSHVLITNMRKPMLSHRVLIYSMGALAVLSYMVYGHHMFVSGMNPVSVARLLLPDPGHYDSIHDRRADLAGQPVWRQATNQLGLTVRAGLHLDVHQRRRQRILPGAAFGRHHAARHLLRGRPLPHGHGGRGYVRHLRRNLFLVPQDDGRMMNETLGKIHFMAQLHRRLLHLHALPLSGNGRQRSPLPGFHRRLLDSAHSSAQVHHDRCARHRICPADLHLQPDYSRFWGPLAPNDNPWEGTSLEWSTATPPPHNNFGDKMPVVYHDPYQYSVEGASADYVMQTSPEKIASPNEEK
jgi:cytochrome c oxidase subunit I